MQQLPRLSLTGNFTHGVCVLFKRFPQAREVFEKDLESLETYKYVVKLDL
jgi:hypothetical protein